MLEGTFYQNFETQTEFAFAVTEIKEFQMETMWWESSLRTRPCEPRENCQLRQGGIREEARPGGILSPCCGPNLGIYLLGNPNWFGICKNMSFVRGLILSQVSACWEHRCLVSTLSWAQGWRDWYFCVRKLPVQPLWDPFSDVLVTGTLWC